jgi:hypothetical protein
MRNTKGIKMKKWILVLLLCVPLLQGQTEVRGIIGKEDINHWDGVTDTFKRRSSTGGQITLTKVGHTVDVYTVYGSQTSAAINLAIGQIGTTQKAILELGPGSWTIDSNVTVSSNLSLAVLPGAEVSISSGITLTTNGPLMVYGTVFSGAGTIDVNAGLDAGDYALYTGTGITINLDGAQVPTIKAAWFGVVGDGSYTGNIGDGTGTDNDVALQAAFDVWETRGGPLDLPGGVTMRCDTAVAMQRDGTGTEASEFILNGNGSRIDCSNHQTAGEACLTLGGVDSGDFEDEGFFIINDLHLLGPEDGDLITNPDTNTTEYTTEGLYIKYAGEVTLNSVVARNFYIGIHTQYVFPLLANYVNVMRNGIGLLLDEASNLQIWNHVDASRCRYGLLISGDITEGDDSGKVNDVRINQLHTELCLVGAVVDPGSDDSNITIKGIHFENLYMSGTYDLFRVGLDFVYASPERRQSAATRLIYDLEIHGTGVINPTNGLWKSADGSGDDGQAFIVFGESVGNPRVRQFWGKGAFAFEDLYQGKHTPAGASGTVMTDSTASFTTDKLIGSTVTNKTDDSSCTITDNDGTTITCAGLAGGGDNTWEQNDEYEVIIPGIVGDVKGGELVSSATPGGTGAGATYWERRMWDEEDGAIWDGNTTENAIATCTIRPYGTTILDSTNAIVNATLGSGVSIKKGQIKMIGLKGGNNGILTVTNHATSDPEVFTFNAADDWLVLQWTGTEWVTIHNTDVAT